jgi:hypothetical protein
MKTTEEPADLNFFQKLKRDLAANRLKAGILGVLVLVLIGAVIRVLAARSSPEPAAAEPPVVAASTPAPSAPVLARPVPQPLTPGQEEGASAKAARKDNHLAGAAQSGGKAEHPSAKLARVVSVRDLPRGMERDIFDIADWNAFPAEVVARVADDAGPTTQPAVSIWTQMRAAVLEQNERRDQRRTELTKELAELQLQSTMTGPSPAAYISGRLVHLGETINGFSVVAVGDKVVKLRKDGLTLSLTMP